MIARSTADLTKEQYRGPATDKISFNGIDGILFPHICFAALGPLSTTDVFSSVIRYHWSNSQSGQAARSIELAVLVPTIYV